jgi:PKD repeat protein
MKGKSSARAKINEGAVVRRLGIGLLVGVVVLVVLPASASAVVVQAGNGQRYGVFLRPGVSVSALKGAHVPTTGRVGDTNGNVSYHGGTVLQSSKPYLIFWDPGQEFTTHSKAVLEQYLTDTAADSGKATDVFSVLSQYTGSPYQQTFSASQAIVDTQAYPPLTSPCTTSPCITDAQIQTELTRLIGTGLPTGTGTNAPIYFVITPQDTNICTPTTDLGCATGFPGFCAYHSSFTDGSTTVLYSSVPFVVWTFGPKGCQDDGTLNYQSPNSDQADNIADDLSHELSETITDPLGDGWLNSDGGNEVADNCQSYGSQGPLAGQSLNAYEPVLGGSEPAGTLYDQAINGDRYYTQTVWSNFDVGCEAQAVTPRFTDSVRDTVVSFDPTASTQSTGSISSFSWDFGDGSTASGTGSPAVINHTYALPGTTYTVTLTLVDSFGNVATLRESVTTDTPTAAFTGPASALPGTTVTFDGSGSSDPDGSIVGYSWSFGDGTTSATGPTTSHTYSAPGTYTVTLTVTDSSGLQSPTSHQITIDGPPTASFTGPASGLAGASVSFNGSGSSDPDGSIVGYAWSFGDGTTSAAGPSASHAYSAPGTYTVTLTVTDSSGLQSSTSHQIAISAARLGKVKVSGTTASVTVACRGSVGCSFTLQLSVTETKKGGNVVAVTAATTKAKTTKKTVVVGTVSVSLSKGRTKTIQIKLNGAGRQLLAKFRTLKVTLAVVSAGKPVSRTTVTFKQ